MGLLASIVKGAGSDTSAGGISSRFSQVCIVNLEGPHQATEDVPAVVLESNGNNTVVIVPLDAKDKWTMFGGAFVHTSDSRFSNAVQELTGYRFYGAVPLHDRVEY
jgi:hypothetical protein